MLTTFKLTPAQALSSGVISYIILGTILLSLPISQNHSIPFIDNLFAVVSALSTTGLMTIPVDESYTRFGELILILMFQIGGWGYMTITSFIYLLFRKNLSKKTVSILNTSYSLPKSFDIKTFILNTVIFTFIIEAIGIILLWIFFTLENRPDALWSATFHSISAFTTAGFGLYNNNLMDFATNIPINFIISVLCYLGAMGFIVLQDVYYNITSKQKLTYTSKIIIFSTFIIYLIGTSSFYFFEPSIAGNTPLEKFLLSSFQVMTASTTAGFNTMDFGLLSNAILFLTIIIMIIGASPSGTGGGIKTTNVIIMFALISSIITQRTKVIFLNCVIPLNKVLYSLASVSLYVFVLFVGTFVLSITENFDFEKIFFEATSALGTVGVSTGITAGLSMSGKSMIILLMYLGRVGPIVIGMSLLGSKHHKHPYTLQDLAT